MPQASSGSKYASLSTSSPVEGSEVAFSITSGPSHTLLTLLRSRRARMPSFSSVRATKPRHSSARPAAFQPQATAPS